MSKFDPLSLSRIVDRQIDERSQKLGPQPAKPSASHTERTTTAPQLHCTKKTPSDDLTSRFSQALLGGDSEADAPETQILTQAHTNFKKSQKKVGTGFVVSPLKLQEESNLSSKEAKKTVEFTLAHSEFGEVGVRGEYTQGKPMKVQVQLAKALPAIQMEALQAFLVRQLTASVQVPVEVTIDVPAQCSRSGPVRGPAA